MTIINRNLYQNILGVNAKHFNQLQVITGYTSGDFLNQVSHDFPKLNVDVYVGMALQGIAKENHEAYIKLTRKGRIKVHYLVEKPLVHQKVLLFHGRKGALTENSVTPLFDDIIKKSLLVTDERVKELIPIIQDDQQESALNESKSRSSKKKLDELKKTTEVLYPSNNSGKGDRVSERAAQAKWRLMGGRRLNQHIKMGANSIIIPLFREEWKEQRRSLQATPPYLTVQGTKNEAYFKGINSFSVKLARKWYHARTQNFDLDVYITDANILDLLCGQLGVERRELFAMLETGEYYVLLSPIKTNSGESKEFSMEVVKGERGIDE